MGFRIYFPRSCSEPASAAALAAPNLSASAAAFSPVAEDGHRAAANPNGQLVLSNVRNTNGTPKAALKKAMFINSLASKDIASADQTCPANAARPTRTAPELRNRHVI
jgi:hypothetical protein